MPNELHETEISKPIFLDQWQ